MNKNIILTLLLSLSLVACQGLFGSSEKPNITATPLPTQIAEVDPTTPPLAVEEESPTVASGAEASSDTRPPQVVSTTSSDPFTLILQFDEDLDPRPASDRGNYRVDGEVPDAAQYESATRTVILKLRQKLNAEVTVPITLSNIRDLALASGGANTIEPETLISFTIPTATVTVDVEAERQPISPYIYGMAGPSPEYMADLGITLHRWGGNANSRYNWKLGNAWNAASDWYYLNTDYDNTNSEDGRSVADELVRTNQELGVASFLTIPTLGWVAKDTTSCSFPLPDGTCGNADEASCASPSEIANPHDTSIEAPPDFMVEWIEHLTQEQNLELPFLAMGNEPDLWGVTHYDVHPDCTGYDEIYERFVKYAAPLKKASPQSQILGPNSCCWYLYWDTMLGEADRRAHGGMDFMPWFLEQLATYERDTGQRLLDILNIHYYPEGLYNDDTSEGVAAHRLRATRSLWDKTYTDESWISQPIYLIPRMKELIEKHYPGTQFGIGEWNWGAEESMNGALAIADVLGILGRESVYTASYWRHPEANTPGYYAFKMYTNYDDQGGRFGDISVRAHSSNWDHVGSYAAHNSATGNLHLMLINKQPDKNITLPVALNNVIPRQNATLYRYDREQQEGIHTESITIEQTFEIELPPYSITHLVIEQ